MSRVLVVCRDRVGSQMAGPGIRALRFAQALARDGHDVTLTVPLPSDIEGPEFELVVADPWDRSRMNELADGHDVVVAQWLPLSTMRRIARSRTRAIYDLYDPWTIEELAADGRKPPGRARAAQHRLIGVMQGDVLAHGDAFVCASERQRDFWLGWLAARGRLTPAAYARDPSLRELIDVVPFGIDTEPPVAGEALRGIVAGIEPGDEIILWGGGIWEWLDAETVIRAVARLAERRPRLRLFFLGAAPPNVDIERADASGRAIALARELGVLGTHVLFNDGWVPHARRGAYLLEADIGVVAHHDDLETRLAFRTRVLDYFWAGLPVITTRGDALADEVERHGLGRTVAAHDADGWTAAIEDVLHESADERGRRDAALVELDERLSWRQVVRPLLALVGGTTPAAVPPRRALLPYAAARLDYALAAHGVRGNVWRLLRRLGRAANRSRT